MTYHAHTNALLIWCGYEFLTESHYPLSSYSVWSDFLSFVSTYGRFKPYSEFRKEFHVLTISYSCKLAREIFLLFWKNKNKAFLLLELIKFYLLLILLPQGPIPDRPLLPLPSSAFARVLSLSDSRRKKTAEKNIAKSVSRAKSNK